MPHFCQTENRGSDGKFLSALGDFAFLRFQPALSFPLISSGLQLLVLAYPVPSTSLQCRVRHTKATMIIECLEQGQPRKAIHPKFHKEQRALQTTRLTATSMNHPQIRRVKLSAFKVLQNHG